MQIRKPSPAMAVACTALFISLGGTGFAAVNFARNAGAVDGKSAVGASATKKRAAGKLVATNRRGPNRGKIPTKFLALPPAPPQPRTFGFYVPVTDNQTGAPFSLGNVPEVGELTATCADQSDRAGVEDPITRLTFNNTSGTIVNWARTVGGNDAEVVAQAPATLQSITIGGSNRFELLMERTGIDVVVTGAVRQDGRGTADAHCLVYGVMGRVG